MADTQSTDTGAQEAQDTTNDNSDHDAALVADEDQQSEESKDESTEESKEETDKEESDSESEEETSDDESEESEEDQEEESDDTEEPSDDPKKNAQRAYKKREEARKARAEEQRQFDDQLQKYVQQAESDQERALRQLQVESYQTRVQSNTDRLVNGYEKAVSQIEIFQNPTPEVKRMLDKAIDNFQARHVQIDNNGNPYQVNGDLYQYLQTEAEDIKGLTQTGARQENQNRAKSRANAMTPPARQKSTPKKTDAISLTNAELLKDD